MKAAMRATTAGQMGASARAVSTAGAAAADASRTSSGSTAPTSPLSRGVRLLLLAPPPACSRQTAKRVGAERIGAMTGSDQKQQQQGAEATRGGPTHLDPRKHVGAAGPARELLLLVVLQQARRQPRVVRLREHLRDDLRVGPREEADAALQRKEGRGESRVGPPPLLSSRPSPPPAGRAFAARPPWRPGRCAQARSGRGPSQGRRAARL